MFGFFEYKDDDFNKDKITAITVFTQMDRNKIIAFYEKNLKIGNADLKGISNQDKDVKFAIIFIYQPHLHNIEIKQKQPKLANLDLFNLFKKNYINKLPTEIPIEPTEIRREVPIAPIVLGKLADQELHHIQNIHPASMPAPIIPIIASEPNAPPVENVLPPPQAAEPIAIAQEPRIAGGGKRKRKTHKKTRPYKSKQSRRRHISK